MSCDPDHADHVAVGVERWAREVPDDPHAAIRPNDPAVVFDVLPGGHGPLDRQANERTILRKYHFEVRRVARPERRRINAEDKV
jgi:hypothetical protein